MWLSKARRGHLSLDFTSRHSLEVNNTTDSKPRNLYLFNRIRKTRIPPQVHEYQRNSQTKTHSKHSDLASTTTSALSSSSNLHPHPHPLSARSASSYRPAERLVIVAFCTYEYIHTHIVLPVREEGREHNVGRIRA